MTLLLVTSDYKALCLMISDFWGLKFNDVAHRFWNTLMFVKIALSSTDLRAQILMINDFWYPPPDPH